MTSLTRRIGVDVGGTFTDFVELSADGLRAWKRLSTPDAPERSVLEGLPADELQVVPEAIAKRVEADDEQVRAAVRERLGAQDSLEDAKIDVAVENGVVRLTGTVASQGDRLTALTVARSTTGVGSVIDGLELKRPRG